MSLAMIIPRPTQVLTSQLDCDILGGWDGDGDAILEGYPWPQFLNSSSGQLSFNWLELQPHLRYAVRARWLADTEAELAAAGVLKLEKGSRDHS